MSLKKKLEEKIALGKLPRYIFQYKTLTKDNDNGDRILTRTLENLTNNVIYFNDPNNYNDPFDSVAYFSKPSLKNFFDNSELDLVANANPDYQKELSKNISKELKKKFGVSCFSAVRDNVLMWSHYANSHTGICLKFDILADPEFFLDDLRYLSYRTKLSEIKLNHLDTNHDQDIDEMIFIKSLDWSYEQEIRLLKEHSGEKQFNKSALKEIIFGCKCEERHSLTCMTSILAAGYENVKFSQAMQSAKDYALEFKKVNEERLYGYYFL